MNPRPRKTRPASPATPGHSPPSPAPDLRSPISHLRSPISHLPPPVCDVTLLAVTGMSPAVLTETVWALAHEPEPVLPARVIAVTTTQGRRQIETHLLAPQDRLGGLSPWDCLRRSLIEEGFDLANRLRFGTTGDDIRVMTTLEHGSGRSRELDDLRTPSDNEAAANFILEQVRGIVENPDTRLIASLAGGRKTMGAILYAALTLAARETDRITHVLVSEPFETLRDFWYPRQPGGPIPERGGAAHDPAAARIDLADLPFVPLRNLFQRELGRSAGTFSRLVESCRANVRQRIAETLHLAIDTTRTELEVNGTLVRLAPLEHLLLLFLARRTKHGEPPYGAYAEAVDDLNAFRQELIESAPKNNFGDWRHADSLRASWDEQDIRKAASGIRTKLPRYGSAPAALASCLPEKGRCSLEVPRAGIHIKG
ncbi:MAG: CRISPR-associated ring nuclease Csm6 [Verrucomicrobiota bacterium]|nr:CRISPR-associated ring nuclease Csm6 [Verrucomicrobiota bacterium]HOU88950.1 CRISPR-associated ring nuclease Csm6 [Verrucomicrobiota bacterium]HQF60404.1 CRISPR-associated ring nuclease Csm6 [Verrucomicrobiota bacterium]HQK01843.1 CRISPR-associated ring nuclease Csm6 [Verrucomicrobiota bacterium]